MASGHNKTRRKALQQTLKSLRTDSGMTQQQLSALLEKPQSYVSKYESGERLLDFVEVEDICDALGLSLNQLVFTYQKKTMGPAILAGYSMPTRQ